MSEAPARTGDDFLTADRLRSVWGRCVRNENPTNPRLTTVAAWMFKHTLSIRRLQEHREEIIRMLLSLHDDFRADSRGGGGSVVMAMVRGNGKRWTDDPKDVEKLIALGLGVGLLTFPAPREQWSRLPGGLPYIRVEITRHGVRVN